MKANVGISCPGLKLHGAGFIVTPEEAVKRGRIKAVWMQLGISNPEAHALLERHGIAVVEDHCIKVEHQRSH